METAKPFCIGMNCALGATQMMPFLQRLSKIAPMHVHAYPNAGLPNAMGGYDETPENFAKNMKSFAVEGLVNMVGGCCGTTPNYIAALYETMKNLPPRSLPEIKPKLQLSGM